MHLVFSLPAAIWRENILAFLALKDIVKSYTAFSNHEVHKQFQALTDGHTLTSPMSVANGQAVKLKWCTSKNILPDTLTVWDKLDLRTVAVLPKVCGRATKLSLGFWKQVEEPIICTRLHCLALYNCTFSSLENLHVFSKVEILSLQGCTNLTSETLHNSLAECKRLKRCIIADCNSIEGNIVGYILDQNTRLEALHLRGAHLHQYNLASILSACNRRTHPSVRSLEITNCTVCSTAFPLLQLYVSQRSLAVCFPLLQLLRVSGSGGSLYNADVDYVVQRCSHLIDLALKEGANLDDAALFSIALHLGSLQHLSIAHCNNVTNEGVIAIANGCARLESLNIAHCINITNEAVQQVRVKCSQLENLNVAGCYRLTDAAFSGCASASLRVLIVSETNLTGAFYKHTSTVTELWCMNCPEINGELVKAMVKYGSNVTALFLSTTRLSVEELLLLSTHVPHVERVRISQDAANDEVVASFVNNCSSLQWMNVMGCVAVTIDAVRELSLARKITIVV